MCLCHVSIGGLCQSKLPLIPSVRSRLYGGMDLFQVVAPTIDSPACQEQLTDAVKQVATAVQLLLKDAEVCRGVADGPCRPIGQNFFWENSLPEPQKHMKMFGLSS